MGTGVTPNRAYPYPLDVDLIDTAGDIGRFAAAVDIDADALWDASVWQDGQIVSHDAEIAGLMLCRPQITTDFVNQFNRSAIDMRIYQITTDGNGNGGATWAQAFGTVPTIQCKPTVEGQGMFYKVVPFQANTTVSGFSFNLARYDSASTPASAVEFVCLAMGTW